MPSVSLDSIRASLRFDVGMDIWSSAPRDHQFPCELMIGGNAEKLRVSPVGFHQPEQPDWLWLSLGGIQRAIAAFLDLYQAHEEGHDATEAEAGVLWALLSREAGQDCHYSNLGPCFCYGCAYERRRYEARLAGVKS